MGSDKLYMCVCVCKDTGVSSQTTTSQPHEQNGVTEEQPNDDGREESVLASSPRETYGPPMDGSHVPKNLWRHSSMEICDGGTEARNESKVLVLYTGGTIGMMRSHQGGIPHRRGQQRGRNCFMCRLDHIVSIAAVLWFFL